MTAEPGTYDEKIYRILTSDKYASGGYEKHKLGEGMEVVNQTIIELNIYGFIDQEANIISKFHLYRQGT